MPSRHGWPSRCGSERTTSNTPLVFWTMKRVEVIRSERRNRFFVIALSRCVCSTRGPICRGDRVVSSPAQFRQERGQERLPGGHEAARPGDRDRMEQFILLPNLDLQIESPLSAPAIPEKLCSSADRVKVCPCVLTNAWHGAAAPFKPMYSTGVLNVSDCVKSAALMTGSSTCPSACPRQKTSARQDDDGTGNRKNTRAGAFFWPGIRTSAGNAGTPVRKLHRELLLVPRRTRQLQLGLDDHRVRIPRDRQRVQDQARFLIADMQPRRAGVKRSGKGHDRFSRASASSRAPSKSAGPLASRHTRHSGARGTRKQWGRNASSKTPGTFSSVKSKLVKPGA